ncbi:MAG: DNA polymerase IV [Eubacteriales bacterium]|nr:DNA polymerase IV [Eubacteriales bacterium]
MNRTIFHIDVNSAFLSWTSVENLRTGSGPDLRTIPAIIGGDRASRHGIVLAKSIPAKAYGIYTSQPVAQALRLCADLVIAPPDHALYRRCSHALMDYLKTLTPDLEQLSIDECFLDFTGISHRYPSPVQAACEIKDTISQMFGFTVNIGISSNKLLAKMASDFEKPDKVHTLFPQEISRKMWPLPVSSLYMAGHSSVATLQKLGIRTIGELAASDPDLIALHLKSHGRTLWEYANGIDDSPVCPEPAAAKGIGNSTTLSQDARTAPEAKKVLKSLAESVSRRLRKAEVLAGNVCVEIKYADFVSTSRQTQLSTPCDTTDGIYQVACVLFDQLWNQEPIRLLGIRASRLVTAEEPVQLSLFDLAPEKSEKQKKLDIALDSIRARYGQSAVVRGDELKPPS